MPSKNDELLKKILSQPTAPFREKHVISCVLQELKEGKVPHFQDPIGNIVIGASSKKDYFRLIQDQSRKNHKEPLRLFMAHMDHPGFLGVRWTGERLLEVQWQGGSPVEHTEGASVWLGDTEGWAGHGLLKDIKFRPSGKAIASATVEILKQERKIKDPTSLFGGFRFRASCWEEGDLLYTKAADDLVGSFSIISLALELFKKGKARSKKLPFLAILTRAEEVGFIGAIGHFELGWLKSARRPLICISLETSRTLPGAEIGKGPVVRLGDKSTVFDPSPLRILLDLAQSVLPDRHQKRVMDGGTCEATAAVAYGIPAIGISIPLGNYHNQGFQGGPDTRGPMGPAPEFVHKQDIKGLIALCHALMKPGLKWSDPWHVKLKEFKRDLRKARPLLKMKASSEKSAPYMDFEDR